MNYLAYWRLRNRALRYKRKHDPGEIRWMEQRLQAGNCSLDIGAHKGAYLYHMIRQVGPTGKVVAFEPQRVLYKYLQTCKRSFRWDHVNVEHLALSDQPGVADLFVPMNKVSAASSPGASLVNKEAPADIDHTEQVPVTTLDEYCTAHSLQPDLLKVDVEGNELKVFKGGAQILQKHRPAILVELEARHVGREQILETMDFLQSLGYAGSFINGREVLPLSAFQFEQHQRPDGSGEYCNNFCFQ